jgi:serine/threonine protein kinase
VKKEFNILQMTCPCDRSHVYQHSNVVGSGSFGIVYATKHKDFATPLVLKCFQQKDMQFAMAEVYVLEKIGNHPNIITFWDAWLGPKDQGYVVLERWGQDLHKILHGGGAMMDPTLQSMDVSFVREVTRDVVKALTHVHGMGLIHADLKPGNILVFEGRAKLCDWASALEACVVGLVVGGTKYLATEGEPCQG